MVDSVSVDINPRVTNIHTL